ncbi:MAG TPA: hypothetical protein VIW92_04820 [Thermoanaerobaculia bacterium]
MENAWRAALAVIALAALAMALYTQFFERRASREEDRLSAARLESELAESRDRLKAEIVAELAREESTGPEGDQPLPNTVLRRSESGGGTALQQVLDSQDSQEAVLARLQERLDSIADRMEQSDRALRRDFEGLRAEVQREQRVAGRTLSLLLVALIPLVIHFLASLWRPGKRRRDSDEPAKPGAQTSIKS